jgi:hypothetical protein
MSKVQSQKFGPKNERVLSQTRPPFVNPFKGQAVTRFGDTQKPPL